MTVSTREFPKVLLFFSLSFLLSSEGGTWYSSSTQQAAQRKEKYRLLPLAQMIYSKF
jgi:hypothetical protein